MPKPVTPRTKKAAAAKASKPKTRRTPVIPKDEEHHFPDGSTGPLGAQFIPTVTLVKMHNFVMHYLETGDSVESVVKAGFAAETDDIQRKRGMVSGLLKNDYVKRLLTAQYESIIAKTGATVERVWQEYARIAFCDIGDAYDEHGEPLKFSEMPEDVRRAITGYKVVVKTFGEDGDSVEKEMKFAGKTHALDQLARLHRMLDNDKLVIMDGAEFQQQMQEGRARAAAREP